MKSLQISLNKLIFCLIIIPACSSAQIDDVNIWLGFSLQKQLTRQLEASFTEELRLNHDITDVELLFSDIGAAYSFTKKWKAELHYRFIKNNQPNYFSNRHRLYVDIAYKEKLKFLTITLRERLQEQYKDIYSSEKGKVPTRILRSKVNLKFDVNKKYSPYFSAETFFLIDDAGKSNDLLTRFRYETGFIYNFNRVHSINPFILYQKVTSPEFNTLIFGIIYGLSL